MHASSGPPRPPGIWQQQSNRPAGPPGMPSGFALGDIKPGERIPMHMGTPRPPNGLSSGSVQPGQVFRHPGYSGPGHNPASGPGPRSTSNPIRPGMMGQMGPPFLETASYRPTLAPGGGPYPVIRPMNQGYPVTGASDGGYMPQPRSVTAPLQARAPGPQRYELHDRVSTHSARSSASENSRYGGRPDGSPPLSFPGDSRSTSIRTPPPAEDPRFSGRSDTSAGARGFAQGVRSDSVSSSSVGANGIGVSANGRSGGRNPLAELMESEKLFVERLGLIVRKVAAAWSRSNLPPPALDKMFRAIEGVYKCSRSFVSRLEEISSSSSSPKAIGDLLIQWIDDLSAPYEKYADSLMVNFNSHPAILSNPNLSRILSELTLSHPPPMNTSVPTSSATQTNPPWTIDLFFVLPLDRLQYYRKLYDRLLKSTREGKSDWKLLKRSCERLEVLVEGVEERLNYDVNNPLFRAGSSSGLDSRTSLATSMAASSADNPALSSSTGSYPSPPQYSSASDQQVSDMNLMEKPPIPAIVQKSLRSLTPVERPSQAPLTDLEVRLDTSRAIDLFSMRPKVSWGLEPQTDVLLAELQRIPNQQCRLQIAPPTLTFKREQRRAVDCVISFTPSSTRQEVVHQRAQIIILSDLFLMCEHMKATEKASMVQEVLSRYPERAGDGSPFPEMWLCYPPLAGRHLSVVTGGMETELVVGVMGKERFLIEFESREIRDEVKDDLEACIDFASQVNKPSQTRSKPPSPRPDRQLPISDADRGMSVRSLDATLPSLPSTHNPADQRPRIDVNQANQMAPPPRNASLRSPVMNGPGPRPVAGNPNGPGYYTPSPPLPYNPGQVMDQSQYLPIHPHNHSSAPPPRSAPILAQNGTSMTGMPPPSRSHDGHSRTMPGDLSEQQQANGSAYMQQLRHAQSTDGLRPRRPSPHHLNIPSPIERGGYDEEDDSPISPVNPEPPRDTGPAVISAQMKCKVFLKQSHQQWKALGSARLKLYVQTSTNIKQLVVESDSKDKTMLISTIVLTDGVERVAKTGVAIEISDISGARTGIIYMIQLRNEDSAGGLFDSLIAGSDRAVNNSVHRKGR